LNFITSTHKQLSLVSNVQSANTKKKSLKMWPAQNRTIYYGLIVIQTLLGLYLINEQSLIRFLRTFFVQSKVVSHSNNGKCFWTILLKMDPCLRKGSRWVNFFKRVSTFSPFASSSSWRSWLSVSSKFKNKIKSANKMVSKKKVSAS
jgi:hypothetical protein